MEKEELLNKFQETMLPFLYERNDVETRIYIIEAFNQMIDNLQREVLNNGGLLYSLKKGFKDCSTPILVDQGGMDIRVELIDGNVITIDEYCELLTNKEKYSKLLKWGVSNFFNNYKF